jgi:hypothetical protein
MPHRGSAAADRAWSRGSARYRYGFPNHFGEKFNAPSPLDRISPNRFDIQWHRHTGGWFRLYRGLTLE